MLAARVASAVDEAANADDYAEAVLLHEQGETALAAGDWVTACTLYGSSQARDPSAATQGRIAQCLEHEGKLTSAISAYEHALELLPRLDVKRQQPLAELIARYMAELEARVPDLSIEVAPELRDVEVHLGAAAVPASELSRPIRLDPGVHTVVVRAAAHLEARCVLRLGEHERVALRIEPSTTLTIGAGGAGCERSSPATARIALEATAPTPAAIADSPAELVAMPQDAPHVPSGRADGAVENAQTGALLNKPVAYALGGLGVGGLVTATILGIRTLVLVDRAGCNADDQCTPAGLRAMQAADRSQTAGLIAAGAGAALLTGGITLLLLPAEPPRAAGTVTGVHVGLATNGLWMRTAW